VLHVTWRVAHGVTEGTKIGQRLGIRDSMAAACTQGGSDNEAIPSLPTLNGDWRLGRRHTVPWQG